MFDVVRVELREPVATDIEPGQVGEFLHDVRQGLLQSVQPHVKVLEGRNSVQVFGNGAVCTCGRVYEERACKHDMYHYYAVYRNLH